MLRRFWDELTAPSDFHSDWYGWATNQIGHTAIGVAAVWAVSLAWFGMVGEYPDKWWAWVFIAVYYAAHELHKQGWQGWDTIEDWCFVVVFGAGGALYFADEISPGLDPLAMYPARLIPLGAVWALWLAVGTAIRLRRKLLIRGPNDEP